MPATTLIKKIKDFLTGDTIYPITKASAVYMEDDTTTAQGHISALDTKMGTTALPTTAQTVTGAIAEHESDINSLNSKLKTTTKTVTGTTSVYGTVNLDLANESYEIVMVKSSVQSHRVMAVAVESGTYGIVLNDAATWSPVTNTSVTLTVKYRPIL